MSITESKSQSKLESQEFFNLNDQLTRHLYINKKEKRIVVSEPENEPHFVLIFSCFQNYEVSACMYICLDVNIYVCIYVPNH